MKGYPTLSYKIIGSRLYKSHVVKTHLCCTHVRTYLISDATHIPVPLESVQE